MPRSPLRRVAATLVTLLFLLAIGEPVSMHACPMHDGVAAPTGASHAEETGGHAAEGHADARALDGRPSGEHGEHHCRCLGHCAASAAAAMPTGPVARWQVPVVRRTAPTAPDDRRAPTAAAYLIPFANGPPHLA